MEPHASTVVWEGDGKITVYDKTQGPQNVQRYLAAVFGLAADKVVAVYSTLLDIVMVDQTTDLGDITGRRVSEIRDELGTMMNEKVAVFRDEKGLLEA